MIDIYNDLDRVLSVLDGVPFDSVITVGGALFSQFKSDRSLQGAVYGARSCAPLTSTYFDVRYFKKGTVHLKWRRYDLLEKFNVTAAAGRKWIGGEV